MAPPKAQSTSLRPYTPMPISNMAEMAELGKMIAASCMFGAKTAAEGVIIAGICHQANMSFLEFLETRHFYGGKVVMKADAMVARFNELGGTHKVMYRTADKAGIALTFNGVENAFTLTWDDVTKEPFIYRGGPEAQMLELAKPMEKRLIKDKYRTPVSRMQMMWARVVSDGVRTICPQACRGTYTPEEVSDFHEVEDSAAAPRVEKNVTPAAVKEKVAAAASAAAAPVKPAVTESAAPAVTVDPEAKPSAATPTSAALRPAFRPIRQLVTPIKIAKAIDLPKPNAN